MTVFGITAPSGPELLVILLIFVLLFGAKKLPELGSSIGQSIKNFKKGVDEEKEQREAEERADAQAQAQPQAGADATPAADKPTTRVPRDPKSPRE